MYRERHDSIFYKKLRECLDDNWSVVEDIENERVEKCVELGRLIE